MVTPGARRRAVLTGACAVAILVGCGPDEARLRTVPVLVHGLDSVASLYLDGEGTPWIGRAGEVAAVAADGATAARVSLPGSDVPEILAVTERAVHARIGDRLVRVDPAASAEPAERAGFGGTALLLDVRGRFLAQGASSGAILGFEPDSLMPVWGWAARGAPTTALAMTPEGDVVWQALAPDGTRAVLLERDVQTGRILDEHRLFGEIVSLGSTPSGDLIAVVADGDRVIALRLRPRADRLTPVWRLVLRLDGDGPPIVRYAPATHRIAVFRRGTETGLRVLDAEAGEVIGAVEETPLDAAFSPDGALYLLTSREVRRVIVTR